MFHFVWCLIVYLHTLCGTSVRNTLQCDSLPFHYFIKCRLKEIPFLQTLCGKKNGRKNKKLKRTKTNSKWFHITCKRTNIRQPLCRQIQGTEKLFNLLCPLLPLKLPGVPWPWPLVTISLGLFKSFYSTNT